LNVLPGIEELLRQHMGLAVDSIGRSTLVRAVRERQSACGLDDERAYTHHLQRDQQELQALVEALVVPETWFFRDAACYPVLIREAARFFGEQPTGTLRLLSLPCATGEEPYSMAMALLDAGFSAPRFRIDACDISERALSLARRAEYGNNSFRGAHLEYRDRHFQRCNDGYRLSDGARASVRFERANLRTGEQLASVEPYQIIFCRNVLIYFDEEAQQHAVRLLASLLTPTGLLFVGPSETGILWRAPFSSTRDPFAFAFRRRSEQPPQAPPPFSDREGTPRQQPAVRKPSPLPVAPPAASSPAGVVFEPPIFAREPEGALRSLRTLEEAALLANQGKLREASEVCTAHLRVHGASARALHLLALLSEASGDDAAAVAYHRKALYLEPDHQEALIHLGLLLQKQGDHAGAERIRQRVDRLLRTGGGA
jgi:chemotaxis protein methyltransferase WspC